VRWLVGTLAHHPNITIVIKCISQISWESVTHSKLICSHKIIVP